jgi:hypothetical protein
MTRLPVVNSDNNAWGTILNAFLGVAHNADGSLNIQNGVLQALDQAAVAFPALFVNSNGYLTLECPPDTNLTCVQDKNGNPFIYFDPSHGGIVLNPGSFYLGEDASHNVDALLGVNQTNGNTQVWSHPTGNSVDILDSSGNVIANLAGTNKVTTLKGGQIVNRTPVSTNYTILASDYIVAYTSTSSAFAATLPTATAGNAGQEWVVKDESGGAATHNITVKTAGGTIDGVAGGTGLVINTNYGVLRVYSNGTNYFTR